MKQQLPIFVLAFLLGIFAMTSKYAVADACNEDVGRNLAQQRANYIDGITSLAEQNYSRRNGPFSSLTCLDNLMMQGGVDIFFQPPSLEALIGKIENLVCERSSEIFDQIRAVELNFGTAVGGFRVVGKTRHNRDSTSPVIQNNGTRSGSVTGIDLSIDSLFR